MKNLIIGMGEALWDVLPEGKKIGGAPANFAYHVSQFGLNSLAISAIGNDKLGDEIVANFDEKKLNYKLERVAYPTGTVMVELDGDGVPVYDIRQNVAWDNIPYTDALKELARNSRAVCFGSLAQRSDVSRRTINDFIKDMGDDDCTLKIFDINLRQNFYSKEIICNSLEQCNVLKINDEELEIVSGMFDLRGVDFKEDCRMLLERYNLRMLILTCGINGSYVFSPEGMSFVDTPKVDVADTVGAGDSFTAAFIASILKGKSIEEAHRRAVDVSAYVCTQNGAMPQLPGHLVD